MYKTRSLFCKAFLSSIWLIIGLFHQAFVVANLLHLHKRQHAHQLDGVLVRDAEKILVEFIWRQFFRGEPDSPLFRFAKFLPVAAGKQREGNAVGALASELANQF